jgi:CRISPR-associated protein Cas5t
MIGVYVSVPVACFRKGLAREYLETEALPPPATCYGFLLSLVGETNRRSHIGCRVTPVLIAAQTGSVVLRTLWRQKERTLGATTNLRPDFQQLLTHVQLVIWLDSSDESRSPHLEDRVEQALTQPTTLQRFGGLSLGESSHLVDEVCLFKPQIAEKWTSTKARAFLLERQGRLSLPVWVDHVGTAGTRYAIGNLVETLASTPPEIAQMPVISP